MLRGQKSKGKGTNPSMYFIIGNVSAIIGDTSVSAKQQGRKLQMTNMAAKSHVQRVAAVGREKLSA